jgi:hypothetical protein
LAKTIYANAFETFLPMPKYVDVGEGSRLVLERRNKKGEREWSVTLEVKLVSNDEKVGNLQIVVREGARSSWVAMWQIARRTVAKLDVESEDKRNLGALEDDAGKLNVRKGVRVKAFTPHWTLLDVNTGELDREKHITDTTRFPAKGPIQKAITQWCKDELGIEIRPVGASFFKRDGNSLQHVDRKGLFD